MAVRLELANYKRTRDPKSFMKNRAFVTTAARNANYRCAARHDARSPPSPPSPPYLSLRRRSSYIMEQIIRATLRATRTRSVFAASRA